MRLSQAEPENESLIAGPAGQLGLVRYYNPESDQALGFEARSVDDLGLAVAGGWTSPESSAWPLMHYAAAKAKILDTQQIVARRFGKPGRTATFPKKVIETYFFRNVDGSSPSSQVHNVAEYLNLYYANAPTFDKAIQSVLAEDGLNLESSKTTFNWDVAQRPAAAVGRSQDLMLRVANTWRARLPANKPHPKPYVYTPFFAENQGNEPAVTESLSLDLGSAPAE
jgi:hypothetical protein